MTIPDISHHCAMKEGHDNLPRSEAVRSLEVSDRSRVITESVRKAGIVHVKQSCEMLLQRARLHHTGPKLYGAARAVKSPSLIVTSWSDLVVAR